VAPATTINPLSTPKPLPGVDTFDVETPPPLDTLKRRSDRSKAKMRAAGHAVGEVGRHSARQATDARVAATGRALPSRPRRPAPELPPQPGSRESMT
jgi:hypothetical protein